jgi:murein DD-endopeptidase MepM/ murein hydrolase activator NlpD
MKSSLKKVPIFLFFFFLLSPVLFSQRIIDVSYTTDNQGNYHFMCNNKAYCTYVLRVEFTTMTNLKSDHALPFEAEVKPGFNQLFVLSPENKTGDTKVSFKSSNRKGCIQPVVNPDFTYLLPIGPGMEAQAFRVNAVHSTGQDSSYTVRLKMKPDDTIYAARRGVVTAVDVSNTENDAGAATTGSWNYVEIVHADCSFGQYGVLKKDGALVKPGQLVEAGTPLGLVGGDKFGRGSDVRFSVVYPGQQGNVQIAPLFWTKGNGKGALKQGATYTSEFPKTIIQQELARSKTKAPATKKIKKS